MNNRISLILKTKNLTPAYLADELGVQRSGISHIINGRNKPSLDFVQRIIKRYPDISVRWLLFGEGPMMNPFPGSAEDNSEMRPRAKSQSSMLELFEDTDPSNANNANPNDIEITQKDTIVTESQSDKQSFDLNSDHDQKTSINTAMSKNENSGFSTNDSENSSKQNAFNRRELSEAEQRDKRDYNEGEQRERRDYNDAEQRDKRDYNEGEQRGRRDYNELERRDKRDYNGGEQRERRDYNDAEQRDKRDYNEGEQRERRDYNDAEQRDKRDYNEVEQRERRDYNDAKQNERRDYNEIEQRVRGNNQRKRIDRIIIFYNDRSFKEYFPES